MKKKINISKATIDNALAYLAESHCRSWRKIAGSSEGILWKRDGYTANLCLTTMDDDDNYLVLEVFPGITLLNDTLYPLVVDYCQRVKTDIGALHVDRRHREIYYQVDLPLLENPATAATLHRLEQTAAAVLREHKEALCALAAGNLPEERGWRPVETDALEVLTEDEAAYAFVEPSMKALGRYLEKSDGYNIVAEAANATGSCRWLTQILTHRSSYQMEISAAHNGFLTVTLRYGLEGMRVKKPYRSMVACRCAEFTSTLKVGRLMVDEDDSICAVGDISLLDGPITKTTLEDMKNILGDLLCRMFNELACLAHGIVPPARGDKESARSRKSRLDELAEMILDALPDTDDEDGDSEDGEDGGNGDDFLSLLNSIDFGGNDDGEDTASGD